MSGVVCMGDAGGRSRGGGIRDRFILQPLCTTMGASPAGILWTAYVAMLAKRLSGISHRRYARRLRMSPPFMSPEAEAPERSGPFLFNFSRFLSV